MSGFCLYPPSSHYAVLKLFRLSGGKIRTPRERDEHLRQLRLGRKIGGESEQQSGTIVESTLAVDSANVYATGGRIETIDGDRNGFETPNDRGYRIGKKSAVTFNLDEDRSDDEECDPDVLAQIKSLGIAATIGSMLDDIQSEAENTAAQKADALQRAAEASKREAEIYKLEAEARDESLAYSRKREEGLEKTEAKHKALMDIRAKTPGRKMRQMIDSSLEDLSKTVVKAKRSFDESRRVRTEPRPRRPFDADSASASDSDFHPINQAQEAPSGERDFKTPHRLFPLGSTSAV